VSGTPVGIAAGPDGYVRFGIDGGRKMARMTTSGELSELPGGKGSLTFCLAVDQACNTWFAASGAVGRTSPDGSYAEFPVPNASVIPGLAVAPDGSVWFTEDSSVVGRVTPAGAVIEYALPRDCPTRGQSVYLLTLGPDGNLWFTILGAHPAMIGRLSP
jgi:virginiamycin B lyase